HDCTYRHGPRGPGHSHTRLPPTATCVTVHASVHNPWPRRRVQSIHPPTPTVTATRPAPRVTRPAPRATVRSVGSRPVSGLTSGQRATSGRTASDPHPPARPVETPF